MALSSQTGRLDRNRSYTTSRRRRRKSKGKSLLLLLAVVVAAGAWWFWPESAEDAAEDGEPGIESLQATNPPPLTSMPGASTPLAFNPQNSSSTPAPRASTPQAPTPAPVAPRQTATATPEPPAPAPRRADPPAPRQQTAPMTSLSTNNAQVVAGMREINEGQLIQGRLRLSQLLAVAPHTLTKGEAQGIRDTLTQVNQRLIFSREMLPDDPLVTTYEVKRGDTLGGITPDYKIPYAFVELINGVAANRIMPGQELKMIRGPFHAVVQKSEYRMDLFLVDIHGSPIYVRSFAVGIGEHDSTPVGSWIVAPRSKVKNPGWTNPRTHEQYAAGDPKNPIGSYWMGLQGVDPDNQSLRSYGIHGTIEPGSIGQQASMGCIRLADDDIALLFNMLVETHSTVTVQP